MKKGCKIVIPIDVDTDTDQLTKAIARYLLSFGVSDIRATSCAIGIVVAVNKYQKEGLKASGKALKERMWGRHRGKLTWNWPVARNVRKDTQGCHFRETERCA